MMKLIKQPSVVLSEAVRRSRRISLVFVIILAACTDYVNQIEDERDEWRSASEQAALLSSGDVEEVSSSSSSVVLSSDRHEESSCSSVKSNGSSSSVILSGDSREESSSSAVKSCSSEKIESSSSSKDPEPAEGSSSSSEEVISSSSGKKDEISSSSEKVESSSSGKALWAYLNPAISYGEMIDDRDGQVYKTVVIDEQTWMAENLNFETGNSYCYNNDNSYCEKYGRLYTWAASMDSAGVFSNDGKGCGYSAECSPIYPARGICPNGWHLPSKEEWEKIFDKLKKENEGDRAWLSISELDCHCGIDKYGLSILGSAGRDYSGNNFGGAARTAFFQTSTITSNTVTHSYALYINAEPTNANVYASMTDDWSRLYAFSVRCLKDGSDYNQNSSSSSIAELSSSSAVLVPPCKTAAEDNCEYGELKDERDSKTYKTVKIGNQWWMAENLNYRNYGNATGRYCYNDETSYCATYGHLYTWTIAQNACPIGWHVPSVDEFNVLLKNVGGSSVAGAKLKSNSGWNSNGNGSDEYGFAVLPAGTFDGHWTYNNLLNKTDFWTSEASANTDGAYGLYIGSDVDEAQIASFGSISYGFSVRCLKD